LKGIGPGLGTVLTNRGIPTVRDLLYFFPRKYEDRSKMALAKDLTQGDNATLALTVSSTSKFRTRTGRTIFEVRCRDTEGKLVVLKYFHVPKGMDQRFKPGLNLIATGEVKIYQGHPEIMHPELVWNQSAAPGADNDEGHRDFGRWVPIYTEIEGIPSRALRKYLWEAVQNFTGKLIEDIPEYLRDRHNLPALAQAIREIHFPSEKNADTGNLPEFNTPAHSRLIYEEFLKFQIMVLKQRLLIRRDDAMVLSALGEAALLDLTQSLPFALTPDQAETLKHIAEDLHQPHPMNRLVQGDVGSGKTAVALLAAGAVLADGHQACLMAPTEILAEQHIASAKKLLGTKLNVALLTGSTPQAERKKLFARLASGEPILLIGTHAILEDPVVFKNLSLVLIDEQHRFGVDQRRILRNKGRRIENEKRFSPHILILTATPIPRTLALTAYGDLSVSSIKTMPPGRTPIITRVADNAVKTTQAIAKIREQLAQGRQAYFIYPLVNESESEGFTELKAATLQAEKLQKEIFPEYKVGLLHGKMKGDEKNEIMGQFKRGALHILVSTTVVEVGVDVPNSTVMVIEHAERFGLSQLHQLRGRVGRGSHQSYCFLFTHANTGESTAHRLGVLEDTTDGFKVSEADLEIRGPGEFLGTRQSGALPFKMGNIVRDRDWLLKARNDAIEILQNDPDLFRAENVRLRKYFEREGSKQFENFRTG